MCVCVCGRWVCESEVEDGYTLYLITHLLYITDGMYPDDKFKKMRAT